MLGVLSTKTAIALLLSGLFIILRNGKEWKWDLLRKVIVTNY
jgi:hypothetical protein